MDKSVFSTDEGIKELVQMCKDGKLFEPIATQADLYIHNYMINKLRTVGFDNANLFKITNYVIGLQKPEKSEKEKVEQAYFGKDPDVE